MSKVLENAFVVAYKAHTGQKRKFTFEPYINHPVAVARIVESVTDDGAMIAAALLHDTVEDTSLEYSDLKERGFSDDVVSLVRELTKKSLGSKLPRFNRKLMDRVYLSKVSDRAKTIKLADVINNMPSVIKYDKKFAVTYIAENKELIEVLKNGGDAGLYQKAKSIIDCYYKGE